MMGLIFEKTNLKINYVIGNTPSESKNLLSDKYTYLKTMDLREMYAFIGLLYARGLLGLAMHSMKILFSLTAGHSIFSSTMSKHHFTFFSGVISFDDDGERRQNWKSDRFAAWRVITNFFNEQMKSVVTPSENLFIDEKLYPMRHQIGFRQYNPKKTAKYDIQFKSLNDARFPFTYQFQTILWQTD